MRPTLLLCALLLAGCRLGAQETALLLSRLKEAPRYSTGPVGDAPANDEWRTIADRLKTNPPTVAQLKDLYAGGTPAAKAFALSLLRSVNEREFRSLVSTPGFDALQVTFQDGCIVSTVTLREALEMPPR